MQIPSEYQQHVIEESTPSWVVENQPAEAAHATDTMQHGAGAPALLVDAQHNLETNTVYERIVYHLPNHVSVQEGSRLQVVFVPQRHRLAFHSLVIRRNGQDYNLLPHQQVRVLHREELMERNMFDGRLQAILLLEGVAEGDVIDYSYSLQSLKEPLFGKIFGRFRLQDQFAAQAVRRRLIYRPERVVYSLPRNTNIQPEVSYTVEGLVDCRWKIDHVKPLRMEPNIPAWAAPFRAIEYGEFASWQEVADAASRFYMPSTDPLPPHIAQWLEQWKASGAPAEEFILQAIRFVQENIRYVSVSIDEHTHRPYPVGTILERNYGDCKDKVTLLCRLLREVGHDATPALVHSVLHAHVQSGLPSPGAFDHVIARLRRDGQTYWIDGTLSDQGGRLNTMSHPDYGRALVLNSPGESLEAVAPSPVAPTITYHEFVKAHRTGGAAELKMTRIYEGLAADHMRRRVKEVGLSNLDREMRDRYLGLYPKVENHMEATFQDDRMENRVTLVHMFLLTEIWRPHPANINFNQANFANVGIHHILQLPPLQPPRAQPYAIRHPSVLHSTLEIRIPASFNPSRQHGVITSPAFQCKFLREVSSNSARIHIDYCTTADHVRPHEMSKHAEAIKSLAQQINFPVTGPQNMIARGNGRPMRR